MALYSLYCGDVPLRNYSLTLSYGGPSPDFPLVTKAMTYLPNDDDDDDAVC